MPVNDNFTIQNLRDYFSGWLNLLKRELDISVEIRIDESIAYDVLYNYVQDRKRIQDFNNINELEPIKRQACIAFWIRKLKPFYYASESDPKVSVYLNELFGLMMAIKACSYAKGRAPELNSRLLADMLFQFRYKSVSPHSLNMVLQTMFADLQFSSAGLV